MKDAKLMFMLNRIPQSDGYFYEASKIEMCACEFNEEEYTINEEVEILSGKKAGDYVKVFPNINYYIDTYAYPFDLDWLLEIFDYSNISDLIADYDLGRLGYFIYHLDPKDNEIELYYSTKSPIKKKNIELHFIDRTNKEENIEQEEEIEEKNITDIYESVTKSIIGQDDAVKKILSSIYINRNLAKSNLSDDKIRNLKQNVLVAGSTGTGKTEIIKQIGQQLNMPVIIEDATKYTQEGYVGSSIKDMIMHLVLACDGNIEKAQKAILVIDEIDKKAKGKDASEIASSSVQNNLLKLIEGDVVHVDTDGRFNVSSFDFNTSKLTIICLGAFSELTKKEKHEEKVVGFTTTKKEEKPQKEKELTPEDFIKFGMTPEFMGRISNIVVTKNFTKEDYRKILLDSKISPLNLKKELLNTQGINLKYNEEFIEKIIEKATKINTGARGLKLAFERDFEDLEFEFLQGDIKEVNLNKSKPKLVKVRK